MGLFSIIFKNLSWVICLINILKCNDIHLQTNDTTTKVSEVFIYFIPSPFYKNIICCFIIRRQRNITKFVVFPLCVKLCALTVGVCHLRRFYELSIFHLRRFGCFICADLVVAFAPICLFHLVAPIV